MEVVSPVLGFCEPISSWLHAGGAVVAGLASRSLWRSDATREASWALGLFGAAVLMLLGISGTYHAFELGSAPRAVFQRLDHAFIWILIAGTFTPVHVILFRGAWRWGMLALIWTCAITGLVLKTVFFADFGGAFGLALYLALGWMGVVSAVKIWQMYGRRATHLLLGGGLLYSVGGAVSVAEMPVVIPHYVGPHELFHVAVLAALYAHWRFMGSALSLRDARPAYAPRAA